MSTTEKVTAFRARNARLVELAEWAAAQDARRRLGLPSEWDQGSWLIHDRAGVGLAGFCGTAACIAGKVALEDGAFPMRNVIEGFTWSDGVVFADGTEVVIEDYARDALLLDYEEADELFRGDNNLEDVLEVVARLIDASLQAPVHGPEHNHDED